MSGNSVLLVKTHRLFYRINVTHKQTHTSVAISPEVIDGADVSSLAGFGLAHSSDARAHTGLGTVFSHEVLIQLQDGDTKEEVSCLENKALQ